MQPDESRFTLFQSDRCIRLRTEADEVMHPSCLVPTVQACGGSAMILGCCSWSGLGSATLCAQRMKSSWLPEYTEWPGYYISGFLARAYSKMTMPEFIRVKLWKSGLERMRHQFHRWIGHHRVQPLSPLRIFGMCWRRLCAAVRLSHHHHKILAKNECNSEINAVTLQKLFETMPQRELTSHQS